MTAQELRTQALQLALAAPQDPSAILARAWLEAVDDEDLVGLAPEQLAAAMRDGFARAGDWMPQQGCRIEAFDYADAHGASATALLILNPDMPLLVDSMVMALRRQGLSTRAVLNAVLAVQRDSAGRPLSAARAGRGEGTLESIVLCLLSETLAATELEVLCRDLRTAAGDAAVVRRDATALQARLEQAASEAREQDAANASASDGVETAAFLDWARSGGFECFGYVYYRRNGDGQELQREPGSALGVLAEADHPVYATCLAGIPGDLDSLMRRRECLSVVKADAHSTLHRDQQLDFIGVRASDAAGTLSGEHCFVGLFSRTGASNLPQMPFARVRIREALELAGVRPEGFRAEKFVEILESLPRTELLEAEPAWLAQVCSAVVALYKQPRAKVFVRPDLYGRHLNVLVYLPRERYGAALVAHLARTLQDACGAREVRSHTLLADGPLARLYLIAIGADGARQDAVAAPLLEVLEGWYGGFERLVDDTSQRDLRNRLRKFQSRLPADYANAVTPQAAYRDLCLLLQGEALQRARVRIETEGQGPQARAAIRLLSVGRVPPLSSMLPALHNAGIAIERERTYALDGQYFVTSLSTDGASAAKLAQPEIADAAQELFEALFNDEAEDGRMNALVIEAGLRMRQVQLVRAYASYWRQAGCLFSLRYMAERLKTQPQHVRTLVQAFEARFGPDATAAQRTAANDTLAQFAASLSDVDHVDTENILRSIAELMLATLRTSYFHEERGDTIVFKFDTQDLALLPQPRPYRELFVFARRFEGVHLRGGPVARGGLRWSDRMEDYRTEVLGLVKAQMVKNAVIVPAGAKGGFVCKMIPKDAPREVVAAEGEAVYRLFIAGLLDLTDNRVQGEIVQPARTVCYDEPDPYLVVAADKGTATFSDIANGIAVARGFWLGDAFASGGSNGYDHKKLGITARGAWESVKRHFHELGHALESEPIAVVGIGDMSGDVFGNGMLRSQRIKLIAAFDHRHIFIDPDPDPAASYAERARLFALPRSSWDDYDKSLISAGGGVWPRSARSIALSPQARAALGVEAPSMSPQALMQAILCAPVDLLYNGGIGTYVKASSETQEQAKDRSNDDIRIDGNQLRCRVVAEGGNLGFTQAGRIEYALAGGHIFTDAIDNSAGVDCSDHEVNLKIWLDAEIAAQRLDASERNRLLNEATPDVVRLVLRDNALQTHLLVREAEAQHDAAQRQAYAALIEKLEGEGALSRRLEHLPDAVQLAARAERGAGLTAPELAVVIANVKNRYKRLLAPCDLHAQWWAPALLAPYFPPKLAAERDPLAHPLANAILATVLANEAVNRCGPVLLQAMADAHRVPETQVLQAWAEAWAALELASLFATFDAHALQVPRAASVQADRDARALMKAALDGVLSLPASLRPLEAHLADLKTLRALPAETGHDTAAHAQGGLLPAFAHAWKEVAALAGAAGFLFAALAVQRPPGMDLAAFMKLGTAVRSESGIARLEAILGQAEATPQQAALRDHALQALRRTQQRVFARVLQSGDDAAVIVARLAQQTAELHAAGVTVEQAALAVWRLEEVLDAQEKG